MSLTDEQKARKRDYYHRNRERELVRTAAFRAANRDRLNARRREIHVYNPNKWRSALKRNSIRAYLAREEAVPCQ